MSPIAIREPAGNRDYDGPQRTALGMRVPAHWRTREDEPLPSPQAYLRDQAAPRPQPERTTLDTVRGLSGGDERT